MTFQPTAVRTVNVTSLPTAGDAFLPAAVNTQPGKLKLSPEISAMVPKLVGELQNEAALIDFGRGVSSNLSNYADQMLAAVNLVDADDFSKPLTDVLTLTTSVNATSLVNGSATNRIPFMRRIKQMFMTAKAKAQSQFNSIKGQIDDIVKTLDKKEQDLRKVVKMLDDVYILNENEYYVLAAHIQALEIVKGQREKELATFMSKINEGSDPILSQKANDLQRYITKIERKIANLQAIQFTCIQTAPQIRRSQSNNEGIIEKLGNIKSLAIPLWKKQCALYISSIEERKGIAIANSTDNTTNALYKAQADASAANAVGTAKALERQVIDTSTLEYANQVLIKSVQEVLQVTEEGKASRADTVVKLGQMQTDIYNNVVKPISVHAVESQQVNQISQ